jgi:3-oxoadipate enol-lactonase
MPTVTVGRIKIYYERAGTGTPILFITGLGGGHQSWAPVVEQSKDRYECVTFDNRGIGKSSKPPSGYTMSDATRDTLGLLEALSIPQAHIIGQSMGGLVAQNIALERPECAFSLVLLGSFAAGDPRLNHVLSSRRVMQKRMTRYEYFWALAAWLFGPQTLARAGFVDSFAKMAASNPHPQSVRAFSQLVDGIAQFDNRARLKDIRRPTLVMVGEQDILTPPYLSRALAEGIPGAKLEVLPGVGHMCVSEDPKGVVDRLVSFFTRVDAI